MLVALGITLYFNSFLLVLFKIFTFKCEIWNVSTKKEISLRDINLSGWVNYHLTHPLKSGNTVFRTLCDFRTILMRRPSFRIEGPTVYV